MAMMHRDQFNRLLFDFVALFVPLSLCDTSEHCVCYLIGKGRIRAHFCDLRAPGDSAENLSTIEKLFLFCTNSYKHLFSSPIWIIFRTLSE